MRRRLARRPVVVARQAVALAGVAGATWRAHRVGPARVVVRARALRRRGFEYREAWGMGLFDPAVPRAALGGYVSRHAVESAQRRLNGPDDNPPSVTRKALFYRLCEAYDLRTPRLLGVIDREAGGWFRPMEAAHSAADWERVVARVLPAEWVVKPTDGFHGLGVRIIVRGEEGLADTAGEPVDPATLWHELRADRRFQGFLVQERIHNHPALAALGGSGTLNTVRIVTVVGGDGRVVPLWASLKLALSGGPVDNVRGGATGVCLCPVAVADGRLARPFVPRPTGRGYVEAPALPDGTETAGLRLPWWDEAVALVGRGARAFLPLRTLGWDVALAADGPVIIEANTVWGVEPTPRMGAIMARLPRA